MKCIRKAERAAYVVDGVDVQVNIQHDDDEKYGHPPYGTAGEQLA